MHMPYRIISLVLLMLQLKIVERASHLFRNTASARLSTRKPLSLYVNGIGWITGGLRECIALTSSAIYKIYVLLKPRLSISSFYIFDSQYFRIDSFSTFFGALMKWASLIDIGYYDTFTGHTPLCLSFMNGQEIVEREGYRDCNIYDLICACDAQDQKEGTLSLDKHGPAGWKRNPEPRIKWISPHILNSKLYCIENTPVQFLAFYVDIIPPPSIQILVRPGQKVKAGQNIIGRIH